ncbi:ATP-binding protein [Leptolyngbya sp. ST-U4]|uniref:hybrid sensor histidine kinase/response regulator n=3 Tax=unclassified Leptolyngbya TaxID=2650499 RepID=UPI0019AA8E91|nr:response regulator [Cyanobacteria bacterium FACHB-502]
MFSRLTLLRDYLMGKRWSNRFLSHKHPPMPDCHPERLPSFEPLLLALTTVLLGLQVLSGCAPVLWLAPVIFTGFVLRPPTRSIVLASLALEGILLLLSWDEMMTRQLLTVGIAGLLSSFVRRALLKREWQTATRITLASLIQQETAASPEQTIAFALTTLKTFACSDGAIVLRQLDNVTAEALVSLPDNALPDRLTTPALFAEAIAQNQCIYHTDYPATPNAAAVLVGQGVQSVAVLPLSEVGQGQGAIVLFWYRSVQFSSELQQFLASLLSGMRNLLRFQDMTLRLENLQARLRAILETIPQGVVFVDESGEQGWLNYIAAMQLGLPQGMAEPMAIAQAMTSLRLKADNQQDITQQAAQFFTQPQIEIRDWRWFFTQPQPQVLSLSSTPINLRHVPGRLWVIDDITERWQADVVTQQAKDMAEAANRAKSEFLANMSHELRTPLNGILGYAQILKKSTNLTEQQRNGLEIIHYSGEHLLTLINDVLDLSKIEARKMELHPHDFHFSTFLENLVQMFKVRTRQDVAFLYEPVAPLPTFVRADEKRLRQVLLNLLGNAIKFTERGWITFRVQPVDHALQPGLSRLRFEVEDTGIGISAEQLEQIFLPFQQAGENRRQSEGTGLGLTITRQLVQLMGSEIQVKSQFGLGSKFWFEIVLPEITDQSGMSAVLPPVIVGYHGDRRRVLVVDNQWENRAVLLGLLQPLGFETMEAVDGKDGLDKAHEFRPDAILMDLVMPVMDGFEAIRQLRSSPTLKDIAIIAVSASTLDFDQETSRRAGCNGFLPKPVREVDLLEHLQTYLNLAWICQPSEEPLQKVETPQGTMKGTMRSSSSFGEIVPDAPNGISTGIPASIPAALKMPSAQAELNTLFDLAMQGDLQGIMDHITNLEQTDDRWLCLTRPLAQLVRGFEEQQILELIRQYRAQL